MMIIASCHDGHKLPSWIESFYIFNLSHSLKSAILHVLHPAAMLPIPLTYSQCCMLWQSRWAVLSLAEVVWDLMRTHHTLTGAAHKSLGFSLQVTHWRTLQKYKGYLNGGSIRYTIRTCISQAQWWLDRISLHFFSLFCLVIPARQVMKQVQITTTPST